MKREKEEGKVRESKERGGEGRRRKRKRERGKKFSLTVLFSMYVHNIMSVNLKSGWMNCVHLIIT